MTSPARRGEGRRRVGARPRDAGLSHYLQAIRDGAATLLIPSLSEDHSQWTRGIARFMGGEAADHQRRRDHFSTAIAAVTAGRQELIRLYRSLVVTNETTEAIEAEREEMRFGRLSRL